MATQWKSTLMSKRQTLLALDKMAIEGYVPSSSNTTDNQKKPKEVKKSSSTSALWSLIPGL